MKKLPGKPAEPGASETDEYDLSVVAKLAKIATEHDLSEVEVEHDGLRVRVARGRNEPRMVVAAPQAFAAPVAAAPAASASAAPSPAADSAGAVKSPMVGTAYLRANPEAKPFIEIGSTVKSGDRIMLVEAMKTFNDIVAHKSGKVTEILVEDGTPVEYGQILAVIE